MFTSLILLYWQGSGECLLTIVEFTNIALVDNTALVDTSNQLIDAVFTLYCVLMISLQLSQSYLLVVGTTSHQQIPLPFVSVVSIHWTGLLDWITGFKFFVCLFVFLRFIAKLN